MDAHLIDPQSQSAILKCHGLVLRNVASIPHEYDLLTIQLNGVVYQFKFTHLRVNRGYLALHKILFKESIPFSGQLSEMQYLETPKNPCLYSLLCRRIFKVKE